jgi:hypothetical protein
MSNRERTKAEQAAEKRLLAETKEEIRNLAKTQGWDDRALCVLADEFISENRLTPWFLTFLRGIAKEEKQFGG